MSLMTSKPQSFRPRSPAVPSSTARDMQHQMATRNMGTFHFATKMHKPSQTHL